EISRMAPSILDKFTLICDRLSHFESRVCNPAAPTPSKYSCQIHLDQVRALWDKVEKEYEDCSELISVGLEGAEDTLPTLKAKYDYSYFIYQRCAAQLMEQIDTISPKSSPVQPPAPQNSFPSGCRLPPCETEVFSGDYLRWPTFRDLFTAVYIDNPTLTPVEKLFYLNAKTSGEAHSIVSNSPLTNDGFRSAWGNLTERFENKRALPALKDTYDSVIQEYIDLGHMKPVPPNTDKINFYLPHHAVFKPEGATTKVRVVFNASSPSSNGNSLNDILYPGPVLQSDLTLQILK
ncbi:hypothetical protein KR059_010402, partial [Drosophila kikkawai]